MPRGYRFLFFAVVGIALLGGAKEPRQGYKSPASDQQAGAPAASYRPYAKRYSDACYDAANHDTADLCAQWRAAIAAEKAANEARLATIAAIVGTILSLCTVIGLIVTIWQTKGALSEARRGNRLNLLFERRSRQERRKSDADQKRALEIADRNAISVAAQVTLMQENAQKELRAYVDIEQVLFINSSAIPPTPDTVWAGVNVRAKNFGSTPANSVKLTISDSIDRANMGILNPLDSITFECGPIMPSDVLNRNGFYQFSLEDFTRLRAGKAALVSTIELEYVDAFGIKHRVSGTYRSEQEGDVMGYIPGSRAAT